MEYSLVKRAIKDAINQITTSDAWRQDPVIVIDYHNWVAEKFRDSRDAISYLEKYCNLGDWCDRELPYNGEDDEEIVVIKYCGGYLKRKRPELFKDYKFYKKINGIDIYRKKVMANFEASVSISVSI